MHGNQQPHASEACVTPVLSAIMRGGQCAAERATEGFSVEESIGVTHLSSSMLLQYASHDSCLGPRLAQETVSWLGRNMLIPGPCPSQVTPV